MAELDPEQIDAYVKHYVEEFKEDGVLYNEDYIRKQITEQRPGILTATERNNGSGGVYYRFTIDPDFPRPLPPQE